jgi:glycosyltransferase involved in cell wall biosynthesis
MTGTRGQGGVLLIAPVPPPYGGMALQAGLLERCLRRDGTGVVCFASNFSLHPWLRPMERIPGLRTFLRAVSIWPKLIRQVRGIEVVHVLAASWLYFFVVVCPAILEGRIYGKRTVLNYRGGGAEQFFDRLGWVVAPVFKAATVVTAPSEFLASLIRTRFHIPVAIVPNILDLSMFQYRHRARLMPRLPVTRHLETIYDIESVLRAFQIVQVRYPEATLWIAGTGSQEAHLKGLAVELELRNVRFLGQVPHKDLPSIYDQCDIYINASRVDNFPGALLEASAAGLPVISSCAGGIPFLYENEKNALLRNPGDWQGLAAAVDQVLTSPSLASQLSTSGAALAQQCDWAGVRESLYKVYDIASQQDTARIVSVG